MKKKKKKKKKKKMMMEKKKENEVMKKERREKIEGTWQKGNGNRHGGEWRTQGEKAGARAAG